MPRVGRMRYHVVRSLAVAIAAMLVATGCGDNDDPPPVDADVTDGGAGDASSDCDAASCAEPTCVDGVENGDETDLDCGGSCAPGRRCGDGLGCGGGGDCQSGVCTGQVCAAAACGDGVRQGNEAC